MIKIVLELEDNILMGKATALVSGISIYFFMHWPGATI